MASLSIQTEVSVDPHHAWEYYFNQINGWWPEECFTSPRVKRILIDTYIGGYMYEDYGEGEGLIWGTVIGVEYPNLLQIKGHLTRAFGGPAITFEEISFKSLDGDKTQIIYELDAVGDLSEKSLSSLKEGWIDLLQNRFRKYCEDKK